VNTSDFETPESELHVKLKIDSTIGNATWNATSQLFEYSFVPTQAGSYSISINVTDADGGTASKTFSNVITAVTQQQMTTTTQVLDPNTTLPNLTAGFDLKSWLKSIFSSIPVLSDLQDLLGTANTLIILGIGLFIMYAIVSRGRGEGRRGR